MARIIIGIFFLIQSNFIFAQENEQSEPSVYSEFNVFFKNEIRYQGVKGNWIFKLNEITGLHKFDYNNDGFNDVLIEFNAVPINQGNYTNYYSVLFQNEENEKFSYVNYMDTHDLKFIEFNNLVYLFLDNNSKSFQNFKLINSKFTRTN